MLLVPLGQRADPEWRQKPFLVEHTGENATELGFVADAQQVAPFCARDRRQMQIAEHEAMTFDKTLHALREFGKFCDRRWWNDGRRAEWQQSDQRARLDPLHGAVGQAQNVIEEAILLVP